MNIFIISAGLLCGIGFAERNIYVALAPSVNPYWTGGAVMAWDCEIFNPSETPQEVTVTAHSAGSYTYNQKATNTGTLAPITENLIQFDTRNFHFVENTNNGANLPKAIHIRVKENAGWLTGNCFFNNYDGTRQRHHSIAINGGRPF